MHQGLSNALIPNSFGQKFDEISIFELFEKIEKNQNFSICHTEISIFEHPQNSQEFQILISQRLFVQMTSELVRLKALDYDFKKKRKN